MRTRYLISLFASAAMPLLVSPLEGQQGPPIEITHGMGTGHLSVADPRPLHKALDALRTEHGWAIDYEDPRYVDADFVDGTDPKWRANHPLEPGMHRVGGGSFTSTYSERDLGPEGEMQILDSIVNDYNRSSEPGIFTVKRRDGRFAVVGVSSKYPSNGPGSPILETKITLPLKDRTGEEAIGDLLAAVSVRTGQKIIPFLIASNVLPGEVQIGGNELPASELLTAVLDTTKANLYWDLLFDPNVQGYLLNLAPTHKGLQLVRKKN